MEYIINKVMKKWAKELAKGTEMHVLLVTVAGNGTFATWTSAS